MTTKKMTDVATRISECVNPNFMLPSMNEPIIVPVPIEFMSKRSKNRCLMVVKLIRCTVDPCPAASRLVFPRRLTSILPRLGNMVMS